MKKEENKHKNMGAVRFDLQEGALVKVRVSTYQEVGRDTIRRKRIQKKGGGELLRCDLRGVHDGGGKISK